MLSYIATATLTVGLLAATPQAPQWQSSYGKALEATRSGDQPLLVVLDNPKVNGARVEPALLSEGSIGDKRAELLKPYNLCHVDVTSAYGKKVAKAFRATSFPHVAIIDRTGSVILHRQTGKIDATEWDRLLREFKDGKRASARSVSHVSYKPTEGVKYEGMSSNPMPSNYCPSCQARQF